MSEFWTNTIKHLHNHIACRAGHFTQPISMRIMNSRLESMSYSSNFISRAQPHNIIRTCLRTMALSTTSLLPIPTTSASYISDSLPNFLGLNSVSSSLIHCSLFSKVHATARTRVRLSCNNRSTLRGSSWSLLELITAI